MVRWRCLSPAMRSRSAWIIRDLPMPASPRMTTIRPAPAHALCHAPPRTASSSSRPTIGVAVPLRRAAKRLSAALRATTRHTWMRPGMPLSSCAPRSSYTNAPPASACVCGAITTEPGSATDCSLDARLGVSPATAQRSDTSLPMRSPITTGPVAMPTRTRSLAAGATSSAWTASTMSSPARTARSASSSCARGYPKYAMMPSPAKRATTPS